MPSNMHEITEKDMVEPTVSEAPERPTVAQEMRALAIQVAANRCEDVSTLIQFASDVEAYLMEGTVPVSE